MTDPRVFYNQEDLWTRATERYYEDVRPVDPYYVMWKAPGASRTEFVLMLPFTPKHRQVLTGWIAGRCDGEQYGRLLAYRFPKNTRVLGTQQVDTRIDQDPHLAAQIALWDQRGSRVIRGNALVIPIEDTLLYVEPIYIQADAAPYPELRVVVLMHGDRMAYASTFEQALRALLEGRPPDAAALAPEGRPTTDAATSAALDDARGAARALPPAHGGATVRGRGACARAAGARARRCGGGEVSGGVVSPDGPHGRSGAAAPGHALIAVFGPGVPGAPMRPQRTSGVTCTRRTSGGAT